MIRSKLSLLALVAVAIALAACGKSSSEMAGDTVVSYLDAFAKGDGEKACDLLTAQTRDVIVPRVGRKIGARDCPAAVKALRGRLTVPQADALGRARVKRVRIRGDLAEVRFRAGPLRGAAELRKSGGDWRVSLLPRTR